LTTNLEVIGLPKNPCKVVIKTGDGHQKVCYCQEGDNLLDVLRKEKVAIEAPCGGLGLCGKCKVLVFGQASLPDSLERTFLGEESLSKGIRLACRVRAMGELHVTVHFEEIKSQKKIASVVKPMKIEISPETTRVKVSLSWEEIKTYESMEEAFRKKISSLTGKPINPIRDEVMAEVAELFSERQTLEVLATLRSKDVVSVSFQQEERPILGAICDIGTTTIACYLLDLKKGHQLGALIGRNPQVPFGADVVSRIAHALKDREAFEAMVRALRQEVAFLLERLASDVGVDLKDCEEVLVIGNSCMHHFFKGLLPVTLGRAPFRPVQKGPSFGRASDFALGVSSSARIRFLPLIGGFVGSDMVGLLYFVDSVMPKRTRLVLDLGTNGEIALIHQSKILVCSAAAGPAFEGENISCGMVASAGAINELSWEGEDMIPKVIGGGEPVGITGSGLVDAVAFLAERGVVLPSGRINPPENIKKPSLASMVSERGNERVVVIAKEKQQEVFISQKDLRQLQLSKGAIVAAMKALLEEASMTWQDVDELVLAGALGNYVNPDSAMKIGLIPSVMEDKIVPVGNGAAEGAKLVLLGGEKEWHKACSIAQKARHIPLEENLTFQEFFMESLSLEPF